MPDLDRQSLKHVVDATPETLGSNGDLLDLGVVVFALISEWGAWVERRVERIRFPDPDTVHRRISVDFYGPDYPSPLRSGDALVQIVPLALLRKRRLTNFDISDEAGRPLPLLSARDNGPVAAATLYAAARAFSQRTDEPPSEVIDDLWQIATRPEADALATWKRLGQTAGTAADEAAWRAALLGSDRFLALASDLARNFLVLTPLAVAPDERRILKMAYDEPSIFPSATGGPGPLRESHPPDPRAPAALCPVTIRAEYVDSARTPVPDAVVRLTGPKTYRIRTGRDGCWSGQVERGRYIVNVDPPAGALPVFPRAHELDLRGGGPHRPRLPFREAPRVVESAGWTKVPPLGVRDRFLRLVAIEAKPIRIHVPAVGHCRSFHHEYEVAAGMQATRAQLEEEPAWAPVETPHSALPAPDIHRSTSHRVHLYRSGIPQEYTGFATFWLRPRTSTILRGAWAVAVLTTLILAVLWWRWDEIGLPGLGSALALLVGVPGGLGAYVARSREDSFTGEVLVGLRIFALVPGLCGLLAAAGVLVSRKITSSATGTHVGAPFWWTPWWLLLLTLVSLACAGLLSLAMWRCSHPPETTDVDPVV